MAYLNNAQKFSCVLNGNAPIPQLMNALAHVTAGLAANLGTDKVQYLEYHNDSDRFTANIALPPFIILKAKNSNQLATLRAAAAAEGIAHNVFVSAMIGGSAEEQLAQTRAAAGAALEYWAVALFGDAEKLQPLTKKFSIFSIGSPERGDGGRADTITKGST